MAEPVFPIAILESKLHPARLEIFTVRATGYFQVSVLPRRPDLNVVTLGRRKTHIAGAKLDDSIMQTELLQYAFCVSRKGFQFVIRFFRCRDFDQLHLVELMHAENAAGFAARRTGFASKTWRIANKFPGKIGRAHNLITMKVR